MTSLEYQMLHRLGRPGWWRPLLGLVAVTVLFFGIGPLIVGQLFVTGYALAGGTAATMAARLTSDHVTPTSLAYLNIALALGIGWAMLLTWALHGLLPRWLGSVLPRIRWRWLFTCMGLAVVALIATVVVSALVPHQGGDGTTVDGTLHPWTPTVRDFVLVIVLLTPFQAAGEEYVFRGYLTQAFGGVFGRRWVSVVVPAALFALAHGGQDPPVFVDRFAFGLIAGLLVIATGGLESGIAMHVLNNFLAYGFALAFSTMTAALKPTGGTWWSLPGTLTQSLIYLVLVVLVARRMQVATRTEPRAASPVLERPQPRV